MAMVELPVQFGKYELLKFLGGGMSHVYRARDTVIGRTVAVKILTDAGCMDPEAKARFLEEARIAGNINHDHIIRIHDYGEERGRPFIVMEFLTGEDLRGAIENNRTGDLVNRLQIAMQVAKALEFVHSQKILHRDIKPDNIHIDETGRVRLMDFGIAKSQGATLTRAGLTLGTPYYMAPEQVLGLPLTEAVDVYAYGILFFELLSGLKAVTGDTVESLFYRILHEPIDVEPLRKAGIPEPVCQFVLRMTAKKLEDRVKNFTEVQGELQRLLDALAPKPEPQPGAIPAETPAASRTPMIVGGAVAAVLVAAIVGYMALSPGDKAGTPPEPVKLEAVIATGAGEMLLVPTGEFLSGKDKLPVTLPAFYIDKTEVSNAAYAKFCEARQRPLPAGFPQDRPNDPVVNITFVDAQEFAKWAGKRLPAFAEWEKAARGSDGRDYPWGNQADASLANVGGAGAVKPVDAHPEGASPFGALNMTGNVWEFVDELKTPSEQAVKTFAALLNPPPSATEPWYVIRGGAFDRPIEFGVAHEWTSVPARFHSPDIGFRCAKTP